MRREPPAYMNAVSEQQRRFRIRQRQSLDKILQLTPSELQIKEKKVRRRRTKDARRSQNPTSRPRMGATKRRKVANRKIKRIPR